MQDKLQEIKEDIKSQFIEDTLGDYYILERGDIDLLIWIADKLNDFAYTNEKGEPKITTQELLKLLVDFELLQKENKQLKKQLIKLDKYPKGDKWQSNANA